MVEIISWNKKGVVINCHSKWAIELKQFHDEAFIQMSILYVYLLIEPVATAYNFIHANKWMKYRTAKVEAMEVCK